MANINNVDTPFSRHTHTNDQKCTYAYSHTHTHTYSTTGSSVTRSSEHKGIINIYSVIILTTRRDGMRAVPHEQPNPACDASH